MILSEDKEGIMDEKINIYTFLNYHISKDAKRLGVISEDIDIIPPNQSEKKYVEMLLKKLKNAR